MNLKKNSGDIFKGFDDYENPHFINKLGWVMADLTKNIMNEYVVPALEGKPSCIDESNAANEELFPRTGDILIVMNDSSYSNEEAARNEKEIDNEIDADENDIRLDIAEFGILDDDGGVIHIGREKKCNIIIRSALSEFLNGRKKYYIFVADEFNDDNFGISNSKYSKTAENFEFQDSVGCILRAKSLIGAQISFKNIYYDSLAFVLWCKFNINDPESIKNALPAISENIVSVENLQ